MQIGKWFRFINRYFLPPVEVLLLIFIGVLTCQQNKSVAEANKIAEESREIATKALKEAQNQTKSMNEANRVTRTIAEHEFSKASLKIIATVILSKPINLFAKIEKNQQGIKIGVNDWSNLKKNTKFYFSIKNESSIELKGELTFNLVCIDDQGTKDKIPLPMHVQMPKEGTHVSSDLKSNLDNLQDVLLNREAKNITLRIVSAEFRSAIGKKQHVNVKTIYRIT